LERDSPSPGKKATDAGSNREKQRIFFRLRESEHQAGRRVRTDAGKNTRNGREQGGENWWSLQKKREEKRWGRSVGALTIHVFRAGVTKWAKKERRGVCDQKQEERKSALRQLGSEGPGL